MLIYLLLADRRVEIVADRGIHARVGATAWETICGAMQREFAAGRYEAGMLTGCRVGQRSAGTALSGGTDANPNELPDAPAVV